MGVAVFLFFVKKRDRKNISDPVLDSYGGLLPGVNVLDALTCVLERSVVGPAKIIADNCVEVDFGTIRACLRPGLVWWHCERRRREVDSDVRNRLFPRKLEFGRLPCCYFALPCPL